MRRRGLKAFHRSLLGINQIMNYPKQIGFFRLFVQLGLMAMRIGRSRGVAFLKCDRKGCLHVEAYDALSSSMIGKPCPRCKASLLTREDWDALTDEAKSKEPSHD